MPGGTRRLAMVVAHRAAPGSLADLPSAAAIRLAYQIARQRDPTPGEAERALGRLRRDELAGFLEELQFSLVELPPVVVVRLSYLMMLGRKPDEAGLRRLMARFAAGELDRYDIVDELRGSSESVRRGHMHLASAIHTSRCRFIRMLPPAERILDLGHGDGEFVSMGYPYEFSELSVIDISPDDRRYSSPARADEDGVPTDRGTVHHQHHPLNDLSRRATASVDLAYCGQTLERLNDADAHEVLRHVRRVLRPGGTFAFDTPNAAVRRLQQREFTDPHNKVEYTRAQLDSKLPAAGFDIEAAWGLVYGGAPVLAGHFSESDAAHNEGLFADVEHSYMLAYICRPN
jgi:SAM-dependent methyltransferase